MFTLTFSSSVVYTLLFVSLYFEVFLLVAFIDQHIRYRRKDPLALPARLPKVAIAVPCFNEERSIADTVSSLLALDYPHDLLEIIVVDDGSRDNTLAIARQFERDSRVRVFHKENGGKHTAMNLALAHTDAEFFGCLDADSVVEPDALLAILPAFAANDLVAAMVPGIHVRNPRTLLQYMQHVEYRLSIFNRFTQAALGSAFITPGPFSLFRAGVVRQLGGWRHGHSTEDMELALRLQHEGYLIGNAPMATVFTNTPRTIRALFRQRVRWTYGFIRNMVDYRSMIGRRRFGNLGLFILPAAIISIGTCLYFFARILYLTGKELETVVSRVLVTGTYPQLSFDPFYINTSTMWFLIYLAVLMIVLLIAAGSKLGTDHGWPPRSTPLFLVFYSFLVPIWLGVALMRALAKAEARWR